MAAGRQTGRRAAGLTAAALVHAGLFLAFLLPRAPVLPGNALSDGAASLSVSLVRWPSSSSNASAPQSEADRLEQLRQSLVGSSPPAQSSSPSPKPPIDAQALLDAFDKPRPLASASPASAKTAQAAPAGSGGVIADPYGGAAVPPAYMRAMPGNQLWPQVSHCWRPSQVQPKVELLLTLDDHGQLTEPPSVVRDSSAKVDDLRLKAEAEAVRAAIACAPYKAAGGARSFRLEFSAQTNSRG